MTYQFSKEVDDDRSFEDNKISKEYNVFDGNKSIGQFFYSSKECFFTYDNTRIRLDIRKPFFRLPQVSMKDEKSGEAIGKYKLTNALISRDCLIIHRDIYEFRRLPPNVKHSILKKHTWGHFTFGLSNEVEQIIYSFKIDYPPISLGNIVPKRRFDGLIDCSSSNKLLILAGLYLVERALENNND